MTLVLAMILIAAVTTQQASAQVLGVSPGNVDFKNVLRGGYAERQVAISSSSETQTEVILEKMGEASDWIRFSEESFSVSRENIGRILVILEPPSDIPNGNYTAFVRVKMAPNQAGGREGHATITPQAVIDVAVNIEIVDIEVLGCTARNFNIDSVEKGEDLTLGFEYSNNGNVRMRPLIRADIWDQEQSAIVASIELRGDEILPTKREQVELKISTDELEIEQYWIDVNAVDCFSSELLTFDVYEPGTLRADGTITGISSSVWTEVGETVPVIISFKNLGEKRVSAQFKGQITLDGRIVQLLESEATEVAVSDATDFTFYFTPEKEGRYLVSGRVFYERKRTFESSAVINVIARSGFLKNSLTYLAYAAIISLAAFLVYKIKKERRSWGR